MIENNKSDSKKRILETGLELKKALADWDDLSKACQGPSPDEQMLKDVQVLLKELKMQIEEFDLPVKKEGPSGTSLSNKKGTKVNF